MKHLLDNIFWHSLVGPHAQYAAGAGDVRRFARGFSPFVAFRDPALPDFISLANHCDFGEATYCSGWSGKAPAGWRIEFETTMFQMVWDAPMPPEPGGHDDGVVTLGREHAAQALELAEMTRPGPFGLRTIELGEYVGVFDGPRLVAMAGERLHAATLREISGVCTHPDFRGRGLARMLMATLIRREIERGETPFLHVVRENQTARNLYTQMGFREHAENVVRIISPSGL